MVVPVAGMAKGRNVRGPYIRPSRSSKSARTAQASVSRPRDSWQPCANARIWRGSPGPVSAVMHAVAAQMSQSGPAGVPASTSGG